MVEIRGVLEFARGGESGPFISAPWCKETITVHGHVFRNALVLTSPQDESRLHRVEYKVDERAIRNMNDMRARTSGRPEEVHATVIGLFETRSPVTELVREKDVYVMNGFGHMNDAPGQILVRTIRDMRVSSLRPR
jgi:hypothetical protein